MRIKTAARALAVTAFLATTMSSVVSGPADASSACTPSWKLVAAPDSVQDLSGVDAISTSDVRFAADLPSYSGTAALRWDGATVKGTTAPQIPMMTNTFVAPSYDSSTDGWALTGYDANTTPLIEHWHGGRWTATAPGVAPTPLTARLNLAAVAAVSPTDAWAIGSTSRLPSILAPDGALIEHWNGVSWTVVPNPASAAPYGQAEGIKVFSPTNIWIVGATTLSATAPITPLVEHWNGTRWSVVSVPVASPASAFHAMAASGPNDIWGVGGQTEPGTTSTAIPLVEHWNGSTWSVMKGLPDIGNARLTGVYASSPTNVWAIAQTLASTNEFLHWNGSKWTMTVAPGPQELNLNYFYNGLSGTGPDDVWAVGGVIDYADGNVITPQIAHLTCGKA